jgi:hypothetical protein
MGSKGSEAQRPRIKVGSISGLRFQVSGLSRLARRLHVAEKEKDMPKSIHVSLDGRSGARVRELDFDLTPVSVSTRTSKGLLVTKWAIKEVKPNDLELK